MHELKHIIESLLFVADEPLTVDKLRGIIETADGKQIREALQSLADEYEQRAGGFLLREIAGGWQMRSRPEYHEWIKRMLQPSPQRLSRAALETLALIAYKQPIIRADIEHVRGVDCGGVLRQLMERKLIRVLGRKEIAGRPLIYATTKLFLEIFDLKDLNDLPTPMEIAEFGAALRDGQSEDAARSPEQIALVDPDAAQDSAVPEPPFPEPAPEQEFDDSHSDQTGALCGPNRPRSEGEAEPEEKNDAATPKKT
jgi:segregation and condensation protein B